MSTSIAPSRKSLVLRLFALSTILMLALAPGLLDRAPSSFPLTVQPETSVSAPADGVVGRVPWGKVACLACAGSLVGAGYGTVIGAVAIAAAWSEYVFWCGVGCVYAF